MSDTYIVTAKTINEAVAKANSLYADADHEISYDIMEMPKKGFLGIGAKEAMIKVTVNEIKDADLSSLVSDLKSMKLHTDRDGKENEEGKKPEQKQPKAENKQKKQNQPKENKQGSEKQAENKQKQNAEGNKKNQNQPKAENKPKQNAPKSEPKAEKPEPKAEKASEAAPEKKDVMPKEHAEVVVSAPVGLFDLPAKEPKKGWGHAEPAYADPAEAPKTEEIDEIPTAEAAKDSVKVAVSEEEMQFALDFANTLLRDMQIDARAERAVCPEGETFETTEDATVYPRIEIVGDGSGILIGHHGETLDAIQYLVNLSAIRKTRKTSGQGGDHVKIVVDVENYRSKREETLRALARRMAARAVKSKRNVFLEPMNAYERRIIHSELQSYPDVSTHSVGSDKNRKIIITYEGADKQPTSSRRRGQRGKSESENRERQDKQPQKKQPKQNAAEKTERPRPKKPQKIAIEQLPDFLAARSTEPDEFLGIED